jgi:hypothetical protein
MMPTIICTACNQPKKAFLYHEDSGTYEAICLCSPKVAKDTLTIFKEAVTDV